jgi:chaperone required for assembly of F1-ATPase
VSTTDLAHKQRVSRRQAAERLTDVAYALVSGSAVALRLDGRQVRAPDADELVLGWGTRSADAAFRLELEVRPADARPRRPPSPPAR